MGAFFVPSSFQKGLNKVLSPKHFDVVHKLLDLLLLAPRANQ
jgi:hypothetical protein